MQISSSISARQIRPLPVVGEGIKYIHISGEGAGTRTTAGVTSDQYLSFNYYTKNKIKILGVNHSIIDGGSFLNNGSAYDYPVNTSTFYFIMGTLPSNVPANSMFTISFYVNQSYRFYYLRVKYELA